MQLEQLVSKIDVWEDWKTRYKNFVPKFIEEAKTKLNWSDWNSDVFYEFFERSKDQCVSSLGQGYFTKNEQKKLKVNWQQFAPILKQIAESQNVPKFDLYQSAQQIILKYLDSNKTAAVHRLIAGLQPNLLTTIVKQGFLNELQNLLKTNSVIEIGDFDYSNWYKASYQTLVAFKNALPHLDSYDLITYPWQTLDYLKNHDINPSEMSENKREIIDLLLYKKQIILQGPPGTGKTRLAKQLAQELALSLTDKEITVADIKVELTVNLEIHTPTAYNTFKIVKHNAESVTIYPKDAKNPYNIPYRDIIKSAKLYKQPEQDKASDIGGVKTYIIALANYVVESLISQQIQLMQFHPSYTYEDFVRGIVAESKGDRIEYKNVNKILGHFAKNANDNYELSKNDNLGIQQDKWIEESFNDFKEEIENEIEQNEVTLSNNIAIFKVESDCFRYGKDWGVPSRINFVEFKKLVKAVLAEELKLTQNTIPKTISVHAHHRFTYYLALLRIFFEKYKFEITDEKQELKNFVLIIDEINRANLSSVLGELVYALEYRGEKVESMYAIDGHTQLILPPNLYIIGTMNTADRSVGHIDYAIRRRFAFVDILPKVLTDIGFETELFRRVSALFVKNMDALEPSDHLSSEFRPQDVWLGHSYFIKDEKVVNFKVKLKYEIIPLLEEYIKDGVLKESTTLTREVNELKSLAE